MQLYDTGDYFLHGLHNQSGRWMRLIKINTEPVEFGSMSDGINEMLSIACTAYRDGKDGYFSGVPGTDPTVVKIQDFSAFSVKFDPSFG